MLPVSLSKPFGLDGPRMYIHCTEQVNIHEVGSVRLLWLAILGGQTKSVG